MINKIFTNIFFLKNKKAFTLIELSIVLIVIGLLVTTILGASSLINASKLSTARTKTQNSIVAIHEDLVIWLETTSKDSITAAQAIDGVDVTSWNDISNKIPGILSFNTPGSAPNYSKFAINNLPALEFNGSSDYMSGLSDRINITEDFTMFAVATYDPATAGSNSNILSQQDGTGLGRSILYKRASNDKFLCNFAGTAIEGNVVDFAKAEIYTLTHNSGTLTVYQNGSQTGTGSVTIENANGNFIIGAHKLGLTGLFASYIGEIIIFNKNLSTIDRQGVEDYLSDKWSIALD